MTVADPLRLSRRDRAALALALECLRCADPLAGWILARSALDLVATRSRLTEYCRCLPLSTGWRETRILRARLALLLRAVLRADAYERDAVELGVPASILMRWPPVCDGCGEPVPNYAIGDCVISCPERAGHPVARQARPLWQSAPPRR